MTRLKRTLRWLAWGMGGLFLAAAGGLALLYVLAQSEGGRSWVAANLEALASQPGEREVSIEGLSGALPQAPRLARLTLGDSEGPWLSATDLRLDWRLLALLSGRLEIVAFDIGELRVHRPPAPSEAGEPEAGRSGLPSLPIEIAVERFSIARLQLDEPVLGQAARFRLHAEVLTEGLEAVVADFALTRSDGAEGRLAAHARYDLESRELELEASGEEPAGGLLSRALSLPDLPALQLEARGGGPLTDWRGRLNAEVVQLARLESDLRLTQGEEVAFDLDGHLTVQEGRSEPSWQALAGRSEFAISGSWRDSGLLTISRGHVAKGNGTLAVTGSFDVPEERLAAAVRLSLPDASLLAALKPLPEWRDLSLEGRIEGLLAAPEIALTGRLAEVAQNGMGAKDVAVTLQASGEISRPHIVAELALAEARAPGLALAAVATEVTFEPDLPVGAGPLTAKGTFRITEIDDLPAWRDLLGDELAWTAEARIDPERARLTTDRLALTAPAARLELSGDFDLEGGAGTARIGLDYPELRRLSTLHPLALAGRSRLEATIALADFGATGEADITLEVADFASGEPPIDALIGSEARLAAQLRRDAEGRLNVSDLAFAGAELSLTGSARLTADLSHLDADYDLTLPRLAALGDALDMPLSGRLSLRGRASGALDSLNAEGRVNGEDLVVQEQPLGRLNLDYTALGLPEAPKGRVAARLTGPRGAISASSRYAIAAEHLELDAVTLSGDGLEAEGRARVPLDGSPLDAEIDGRIADFRPLATLGGVEAGGRGKVKLALSDKAGKQAIRLEADLAELSIAMTGGAPLEIAALRASASSDDLRADPRGEARARLEGVALEDLAVETLEARASGGLAAASLEAEAAGRWLEPFRLAGAAELAADESALSLRLARLEGEAFGQPVTLRQPLRLTQGAEGSEIADLALTLGEARITADGRLGPKRLTLEAAVEALPLAMLAPFAPLAGARGRLDMTLSLSGSPEAPKGKGRLTGSRLYVAGLPEDALLELALVGNWTGNRLEIDGKLGGLAEEDAVLSGALPLGLDPETLSPLLPPEAPLSAKLAWRGEVAPLWTLVPLAGHHLTGTGDVRIDVAGSLAKPELRGKVALTEAAYEEPQSGVQLEDLELRLALEGNSVKLTSLQADDGKEGTLSATGKVDLVPERGFPLELQARFEKFQLLRRDEVTASADGEVKLSGSTQAAALWSRLHTRNVEIRIPERLPSTVVDLQVVESGAEAEGTAPENGKGAPDAGPEVALDLAVDMPRRVFVRGRGLDTEWGGALTVGGTLAKPVLSGKLAIVRGQVTVLNETFTFQEGSLEFVGSEEPEPILDITATRKFDAYLVTVKVAGPASRPEITLSSNPTLPQDEIVSRIVFGKSTTQLSAIEAVNLASAVAALSGVGVGGPGVLDRLRSALGVDVLRVGSKTVGDKASPAVSAGKYLTEDVYVGVTQGTAAESGAVEVEVEITPNISLESEVGASGNSNVGVKFKWDY